MPIRYITNILDRDFESLSPSVVIFITLDGQKGYPAKCTKTKSKCLNFGIFRWQKKIHKTYEVKKELKEKREKK